MFTREEEKRAMQARVRSRQETVNKRFKQWAYLKQQLLHPSIRADDIFDAASGNRIRGHLFEADYSVLTRTT